MSTLQTENLADYLGDFQLSDEALTKLAETLPAENVNASFRLGESDGIPYYASIISLDYKNWKAVVIFRANETGEIINSLFHITIASSLV